MAAKRPSDRSVANIVKAVRGTPAPTPALSGAILTRWLSDVRGYKGVSIFKTMDVSRHQSVDTLRGYVRDTELFEDHAGAGLL